MLYIYNIICVFYYTHDTITLYNIVHHICTHGRLGEWNLATVNLSLSASQLTSWRRLIFSKTPARRWMRSLNGVYIDYPNTAYSSKSCKTFFLVRDTFCFCMRQSQTIVKHGQSHYDHRSLLEVFFQVHTPQFDCMCVNLCHLINFPSAM